MGGLIGTVTETKNGLMPSTGFIQRKQITGSEDYNNFIDPGIYDISEASDSLNSPYNVSHGVLIVFCQRNDLRIMQMVIEVPNNVLYIRCRAGNRVWGEWKRY